MSDTKQPTALDILRGAPNPNYRFFGDEPLGMDGFLRALRKDCDAFRDEIERQLFGDDNELSDEKKTKIKGNTDAKLPNQA